MAINPLNQQGGLGSTPEAQAYFAQNPDVASAFAQNNFGLDPDAFAKTHFERFGRNEQRVWGLPVPAPAPAPAPVFTPEPEPYYFPSEPEPNYFQAVTPLTPAPVPAPAPTPAQPATLGSTQEARDYFARNPDVAESFRQNNFGLSADAFARTHFERFGSKEQRGWGAPSLTEAVQWANKNIATLPGAVIDPYAYFSESGPPVAPTFEFGPYQITARGTPQFERKVVQDPTSEFGWSETVVPVPGGVEGYNLSGVQGKTDGGVNYEANYNLDTSGKVQSYTVNFKTGGDSGYIVTFDAAGNPISQEAYDRSESWRKPASIGLSLLTAGMGLGPIGNLLSGGALAAGSTGAAMLGAGAVGAGQAAIGGASDLGTILKQGLTSAATAGAGSQLSELGKLAGNTASKFIGDLVPEGGIGDLIANAAGNISQDVVRQVGGNLIGSALTGRDFDFENALTSGALSGLSSTAFDAVRSNPTLRALPPPIRNAAFAAISAQLRGRDPGMAAINSIIGSVANQARREAAATSGGGGGGGATPEAAGIWEGWDMTGGEGVPSDLQRVGVTGSGADANAQFVNELVSDTLARQRPPSQQVNVIDKYLRSGDQFLDELLEDVFAASKPKTPAPTETVPVPGTRIPPDGPTESVPVTAPYFPVEPPEPAPPAPSPAPAPTESVPVTAPYFPVEPPEPPPPPPPKPPTPAPAPAPTQSVPVTAPYFPVEPPEPSPPPPPPPKPPTPAPAPAPRPAPAPAPTPPSPLRKLASMPISMPQQAAAPTALPPSSPMEMFYGRGAVRFGPESDSMADVTDFQGRLTQAREAMELALEGEGGENQAENAYERLMAMVDENPTVDELMKIIGRA